MLNKYGTISMILGIVAILILFPIGYILGLGILVACVGIPLGYVGFKRDEIQLRAKIGMLLGLVAIILNWVLYIHSYYTLGIPGTTAWLMIFLLTPLTIIVGVILLIVIVILNKKA